MTYNVFSGTLNPTHFTSLSTNCNYQKSLTLDIKLFELRNIYRLHYSVVAVFCMDMLKRNADAKLLDVLVMEKITNLTNVIKNQLNASTVLENTFPSQNPAQGGKLNKKLLV